MDQLIGHPAPHFSAKAVVSGEIVSDFSLDTFRGKYVVFFFYPLDFTFVCPTELHAFQDQLEEFEKRDTELIACSVDSCYTHLAWLRTPKEKGGIEGVDFPLVSDLQKTISKDYGVFMAKEGISLRGLFILDREGIIRHQTVNDLPIGRSVDEVLRTLDALISFDAHGEVCPANWKVGMRSMKPTKEGLEKYYLKTAQE
ncbi:MAG: peroxiredoxin [Parachlamydiaceae bacterium]|nr:peroxiredoxin [Parachlamydiaceae bacterium]